MEFGTEDGENLEDEKFMVAIRKSWYDSFVYLRLNIRVHLNNKAWIKLIICKSTGFGSIVATHAPYLT